MDTGAVYVLEGDEGPGGTAGARTAGRAPSGPLGSGPLGSGRLGGGGDGGGGRVTELLSGRELT